MSNTACETCSLRQKDCFRPLEPDELSIVSSEWRGEKTLPAFRPIVKTGDAVEGLFVLREGWAAVCPDVPGQPLRASEILLPGDRIGLGACLRGRHRYTVVALTRVRYCVL